MLYGKGAYVITIGQYTQDGLADYGPDYFVEQFLSICAEHRDQNRALLFAFLLYDFNHPHVMKVLQDIHYWNGLDTLSGSSISVFAFHSPANTHEPPAANRLPAFNEPVTSILDEHFGITDATMPTLLFFQVADEQIIGQHLVQLSATTIESAFGEINSVLKDAVSAVSNVSPENYGNAQEIFNLVSNTLGQRQTVESVQRAVRSFTSLEKLAKRFAGIL